MARSKNWGAGGPDPLGLISPSGLATLLQEPGQHGKFATMEMMIWPITR